MLLPTAKKQMRKLVAQRVGALDESAIREQSAAVAVCNRLCAWLRQEEPQLFVPV